jgi:hypothetical protein
VALTLLARTKELPKTYLPLLPLPPVKLKVPQVLQVQLRADPPHSLFNIMSGGTLLLRWAGMLLLATTIPHPAVV